MIGGGENFTDNIVQKAVGKPGPSNCYNVKILGISLK